MQHKNRRWYTFHVACNSPTDPIAPEKMLGAIKKMLAPVEATLGEAGGTDVGPKRSDAEHCPPEGELHFDSAPQDARPSHAAAPLDTEDLACNDEFPEQVVPLSTLP